jgi:hypothetical protein
MYIFLPKKLNQDMVIVNQVSQGFQPDFSEGQTNMGKTTQSTLSFTGQMPHQSLVSDSYHIYIYHSCTMYVQPNNWLC